MRNMQEQQNRPTDRAGLHSLRTERAVEVLAATARMWDVRDADRRQTGAEVSLAKTEGL